ncbi:RNA polymerase sigma factor [Paraflavitalea soli]|uniref:RNA polymerase sigma factor n=1 Tax=Paraflavitalea soli TaxID=2315862 RepID=UPI0013C435DC|nr:sigma-70 family RNA polymerase sigma factor [Paraflavitalea soli]
MAPNINDTETNLLLLLRAGDEQAFTQIYNLYWEKLFFIAHKRLQSVEDAKEIVQNVFFTLWQKRAQLEIQHLSFYLAAMTRYAVYRHLSNEKRKAGLLSRLHGQRQNTDSFDIDNKQLLDLLVRFAEDLPENYRLVFLHHKLLDEPLESVAKQLGVSPRTAERYVSKVLSIIRHRLQKSGAPLLLLFL